MPGSPGSWLPHSLPRAARKASLRTGLYFPPSISKYGLNMEQGQRCVSCHCGGLIAGWCLWGV